MAHPDRSNFFSPDAGSAWWETTHADAEGNEFVVRCSTTGAAFARAVQRALYEALPTAGLPGPDGRVVRPVQLVFDGRWDAVTLRALWAVLSANHADPAMLAAVQRGLDGSLLDRDILRAGLEPLLASQPDLVSVSFPVDVLPLQFGVASPEPTDWAARHLFTERIVCEEVSGALAQRKAGPLASWTQAHPVLTWAGVLVAGFGAGALLVRGVRHAR